MRSWPLRNRTIMASTITVDTREGHLGITCSTADVCYGVHVDNVSPKDLLALAGLRAGMVITKINGKKVSDHERAAKLWTRCQNKGEKLTIEYLTKEVAEEVGRKQTMRELKCYGFIMVLMFVGIIALFSWVYVNKPPTPDPSTLEARDPGPPKTGDMFKDMQASIEHTLGKDKLAEMREMMAKNMKVADDSNAAAKLADEAA
uniref:PDZ domain-containing protein n=1 Tax=Haptolina brevifila TaxID=156173 RepID=A0A7S2IPB6_9EUKA